MGIDRLVQVHENIDQSAEGDKSVYILPSANISCRLVKIEQRWISRNKKKNAKSKPDPAQVWTVDCEARFKRECEGKVDQCPRCDRGSGGPDHGKLMRCDKVKIGPGENGEGGSKKRKSPPRGFAAAQTEYPQAGSEENNT